MPDKKDAEKKLAKILKEHAIRKVPTDKKLKPPPKPKGKDAK